MRISKARQSVIAITAGFLLIAWLQHSLTWLIISIAVAATLPFNFLNRPVHNVWMGLSKILGTISSHIILFAIFFLFLTPLSFIRKLVRKGDPLRDFPGNKNSNFYSRGHEYNKEDFLNPW
jgi:hypothetical protein